MSATFRASIVALLLAIATLVAFWPVLENGFVDFDDPRYVTENARVREGLSLEGVAWAFGTTAVFNWHPLTWLSHMSDVELFGLDPRGHHAMSLGIHTINGVLLFLILRWLTGAFWCSALAACLLALHPLRVESVAWAAERKDVLGVFFWLATIAAYGHYARGPGALRYLAVVLLYALGLLCKPMLVTLPLVFLLLDAWPLDRLALYGDSVARHFPWRALRERGPRLVAEKLPLLGMAAASGVVTVLAQREIMQPTERFPLASRVANALLAYLRYIAMELWPTKLSVFYPHALDGLSSWSVFLASAALLTVTALVLVAWRRPYLAVGWFWYLGTLVPVIGVVQVGVQAVADRYTYIPSIGLSLLVVWGAAAVLGRSRSTRVVAGVVSIVVLILLVGQTRGQVRVWKDSVSLYRHAVAVTTENRWAEYQLGRNLMTLGEDREALAHFREAVRLKPLDKESWLKIGLLLERQGHPDEAIAAFSRAASLRPADPRASIRLARVLTGEGRLVEAESVVEEALVRWPSNPTLLLGMGTLLSTREAFPAAIPYLRRAVTAWPGFVEAHNRLGAAYTAVGNLAAAEAEFEAARRADPGRPQTRDDLERMRATRGAAEP